MKMRRALLAAVVFGASTSCNRPADYAIEKPTELPSFQKPGRVYGEAERGGVVGNVTNAMDGRTLSGVGVSLHFGVPGSIVTAGGITDSRGSYEINRLNPGAYFVDFMLQGFVPIERVPVAVVGGEQTRLDATMTNVLQAHEIRVVLNWRGKPTDGTDNLFVRDVDSYLQVPGVDPRRPIGYSNQTPDGGGPPLYGAKLDHDMTQWSGPETITISLLKLGTYIYYVNNFENRNNRTALGNSSVVIRLYKGSGLLKTYRVPAGTGITFDVFHIVDGNIEDSGRYNDNLFTW